MILTWVVEKQTEMNPSYSVYCLSLFVYLLNQLWHSWHAIETIQSQYPDTL